MPRIHQLDAAVVNKIAAGEVIERPASVVKELLENSVDSLAGRIDVEVADGGSERIRIVDDGDGIDPEDLILAVSSNATSKIRTAEDLFGVHTMGFRGEALASIAAVSRFRIRSRLADAADGTELFVDCGTIEPPRPCGCPAGTSIEVEQLFSNTPVRRRFLKRPATEFGHIAEQFTRIALANPRLQMRLVHNDKPVYDLPVSDRLVERLALFAGQELADGLIAVESQTETARIWGYVGHPAQSKSNRKGQYLFLNGRWIQDRTLAHALSEAYRGLLMTGRHPIAYLFIELEADQVDVNVHPTKIEVRFRDGQQLYRQLLSMLRTRFLGLDFQTALRVDRPAGGGVGGGPHQAQLNLPSRPGGTWPAATAPATSTSAPFDAASAPAPAPHDPVGTTTAAVPVPAVVDEVRALQVLDCYLVAETEDGLAVFDQHALHERILYEELKQRMLSGTVESQQLLVPETVELGAREVALLSEYGELLAELGFGVREFGRNTVLVDRYPALLHRADRAELVQDIAGRLEDPERAPDRRDILDRLLQTMACRAAIKAGQRLTPEEITSLLDRRHLVDDAHHCPHGRPTALVLSQAELDRQFGRLG